MRYHSLVKRIVVDTNLLVAAIPSRDSAAGEVLKRCLTGKGYPLMSNVSFLAHEELLAREELFAAAPIDSNDRTALLDEVLSVCQWIDVAFLWRPDLPDERDNRLAELAVAGAAGYIVTANTKHVARDELVFNGFRVYRPSTLAAGGCLAWLH